MPAGRARSFRRRHRPDRCPRPAGADQSVQRRCGTKARDISGCARRVVFEISRELPRMSLDAVAGALQERLFQVAIAQPSDRGNRDRDQRNHRDGKPGCERHVGVRSPSRSGPASRRTNRMLWRITGRKQHRRAIASRARRLPGSRRRLPAGLLAGTVSAGWRSLRAWSPWSGSQGRCPSPKRPAGRR